VWGKNMTTPIDNKPTTIFVPGDIDANNCGSTITDVDLFEVFVGM